MLRPGIFYLLLLVSCWYSNVSAQNEPLNYIFRSGTEGYNTFRIPAIITTPAGTLLAFAEGRKNGSSDTGDIDLVMKRSEDNGKTWGPLTLIRDDASNVCGNPAPVVESKSGKIFLLSTWNLGPDKESMIIDGTSRDTRRIFIMESSDDGHSWSAAKEITTTVKNENWTWYATGPCHGIQISEGKYKGRLVIPCDHIEAGTKKYYSHVIVSDDRGLTWSTGGTTIQDKVNECGVAELDNGRLMLNMRNYDRSQKSRRVAISDDGGDSWGDIFPDTVLVEPICQASILSYDDRSGDSRSLLFLNPADKSSRKNMTLRYSPDEGKTWTSSIILWKGPSAYSDLTMLNGRHIAFVYEAGIKSPYEGIVFGKKKIRQLK